jgi:hypothetical protein
MPPTPSISERRTMPTPEVSQRPTPVTPHVSSSGSKQPGPDRGSVQPARSPSVTFGGYRGGNEARDQSLRGQNSRQSSEGARSPAAPASHGNAPAGGKASGDRQRR